MRTVAVNLNPGFAVELAIGIATDVSPAIDQKNILLKFVRDPFGNRRTIETCADDKQVNVGKIDHETFRSPGLEKKSACQLGSHRDALPSARPRISSHLEFLCS